MNDICRLTALYNIVTSGYKGTYVILKRQNSNCVVTCYIVHLHIKILELNVFYLLCKSIVL